MSWHLWFDENLESSDGKNLWKSAQDVQLVSICRICSENVHMIPFYHILFESYNHMFYLMQRQMHLKTKKN